MATDLFKSWNDKSESELRDFISKGVAEINERSKTAKLVTERSLIKQIKDLQGSDNGVINADTEGLAKEELVYRARRIDRFLKIDRASKSGLKNLSDVAEQARLTFNNDYGVKLSKAEYRDMVELIGAFKDGTDSMGSNQIFEYIQDAMSGGVTADELSKIFGEVIQEKQGITESERVEAIFDKIDELREMKQGGR